LILQAGPSHPAVARADTVYRWDRPPGLSWLLRVPLLTGPISDWTNPAVSHKNISQFVIFVLHSPALQ
jgi:hypothetical protein